MPTSRRRQPLTLSGHSLRCWVEAIRVTTRSLRADSDATWIVAVTVLVAHSTQTLGPGPLDAAAMWYHAAKKRQREEPNMIDRRMRTTLRARAAVAPTLSSMQ